VLSCEKTTSSNPENDKKLSSSDILIDYDWCWPDCANPVGAFKFHQKGTFNNSTKAFNIGTREGVWKDIGNSEIALSYYDGTNVILIIKSKTTFSIGNTLYLRD